MKKFILPKVPSQHINIIPHIDYSGTFIYPIQPAKQDHTFKIGVRVGDEVESGDLLTKNHNPHSLTQHSAVGGKVTEIKNHYYPGSASDIKSIKITFGGQLSTYSNPPNNNEYTDKTFLKAIYNSGIYDKDMGVLHSYLTTKQDIKYICVNAIEFSPLLILEEIILQKHIEEITCAIQLLTQHMTQQPVQFILLSNNRSSKKKFTHALKKLYNSTLITTQGFSKYTSDTNNPPNIHDNLRIISQVLETLIAKMKQTYNSQPHTDNNILLLRPSTLLAIYEAVINQKPAIDTYIQFVTSPTSISIRKVPYGMLLIHLLAPFNKNWREFPNHCFTGCFLSREIITNIVTPINKQHSYYWLLTDNHFHILYKKLQHWTNYSHNNRIK